MQEYEFTLKFAVPESMDAGAIENQLFEAGCDDALVGIGSKGRLALAFSREAESAREAIVSAITDSKRAIPEVRLIEAGPDLVGVTDIAEMFSFSRQNMRKLLQSHLESFPLPLHEGRASLWHLADVLKWFEVYRHQAVGGELQEVAEATMKANMARELQRVRRSDLESLKLPA